MSIETSAGLERRMTVRVPTAEIERAIAARLAQVGKTAKLKGFRPGKVPQKVVRQYYGGQVRDEVMTDVIRTTYSRAIAEQKLNPAGGPRIEPLAGADAGGHFTYRATFEVYPEIALQPLGELAVEVPSVDDRGRRPRCHDREAPRPTRDLEGGRTQSGGGRSRRRRFFRHRRRRAVRGRAGQEHFDRARLGAGPAGFRPCVARHAGRRERDRDGLVPAGLSDDQPRRQDGGIRDQRAASRRAATAGARRRVRRDFRHYRRCRLPCAAKCATTWSAS